ncbi:hypothetical protein J7643_19085 [bacterium]|nr:hypothetical protein [bacterium]
MLEDIFMPEIDRYRITIDDKRVMVHAAYLTAYPWGAFRLSLNRELYGAEKLEAAGMQIARIVLGHDFQRSGFRQEYVNRKEWDQALLWLSKRLICNRLMRKASREKWEAWQLAEEAGVTEAIAWRRWADDRQVRGLILPFVSKREQGATCERAIPFFE